MVNTPVGVAGQGLKRAVLEVITPRVLDPIIPLCFNPTEYQRQKANNFAEIGIPGLESPPIQYVRGASEKLTAELLADTSDTLDDVRTAYTDRIRGLMNINAELHAPPIVRLAWGSESFKGVIESLNITFVLFTPDGVPLRAKLSLTLREYRPVDVQVRQRPKNSPDVEKGWVVRRGDTLSGIAGTIYRDPSQWRKIAVANSIIDPRDPPAGLALTIPRLRLR
jgi:nucleoid-associated protein YgaU